MGQLNKNGGNIRGCLVGLFWMELCPFYSFYCLVNHFSYETSTKRVLILPHPPGISYSPQPLRFKVHLFNEILKLNLYTKQLQINKECRILSPLVCDSIPIHSNLINQMTPSIVTENSKEPTQATMLRHLLITHFTQGFYSNSSCDSHWSNYFKIR